MKDFLTGEYCVLSKSFDYITRFDHLMVQPEYLKKNYQPRKKVTAKTA